MARVVGNVKGAAAEHGVGGDQRETALACGPSQPSVQRVLKRAREAGLAWPLPKEMDDGALAARLYGMKPLGNQLSCLDCGWASLSRTLTTREQGNAYALVCPPRPPGSAPGTTSAPGTIGLQLNPDAVALNLESSCGRVTSSEDRNGSRKRKKDGQFMVQSMPR